MHPLIRYKSFGVRATNEKDLEATVAPAIFGASLTLLAILVGVVGVLVGEIGRLHNIPEFASAERALLAGAVVLIAVNAWCAFWSLRLLQGASVKRGVIIWPMLIQPWAILVGVLVWVIVIV